MAMPKFHSLSKDVQLGPIQQNIAELLSSIIFFTTAKRSPK